MVDGLDGGVGVVDRRGQGLAGDVHELADPEGGVLFQGPFEADPDRLADSGAEGARVGGRIVRVGAPDPRQRRPGDYVFPDPRADQDGHLELGGQRQEAVRVSGLHVAGAGGGHGDRPGRRLGGGLFDIAGLDEHDLHGAALDQVGDRVDLDRMRQVFRQSRSPSPDWRTAAGSAVIDFWTDRLRTDPAHATAATVAVGAEPVGLAITDDGWLVVANSNRSSPGTVATLAVIDARTASDRQATLRAYVPAGVFSREITTLPHTNTVLVGNYGSRQLQLVTLTSLR